MSIQTINPDDLEKMQTKCKENDMVMIDLSDNELAKVHGRHLVGGRAPAGTDFEKLISFEFPERPGALKTFLNCMPNEINISLFHYRNHGADIGRVLVAFIVRPE